VTPDEQPSINPGALRWATFIGGPNDGANGPIDRAEARPFIAFYDWPDKRRGYVPPVSSYVAAANRECAEIELRRLEDDLDQERERFNNHECDSECHAWLDEITEREARLERHHSLVQNYGFENGGILYFYHEAMK